MSSEVIQKGRLSAYERWELDSFDPAATGTDQSIEVASASTIPTPEQIQMIRHQAASEGRAEGLSEGRSEGHSAGYQMGKNQAQEEIQQLQHLLGDLDDEIQHFDQRVSKDLLTLSLAIAKQMIGKSLKIHPELILEIVQESIRCLPHFNQHAHVLLHPEDAVLVRSYLGDHLNSTGWKIIEDTRIERGGCRLETSGSEVDATLPNRWKSVLSSISQDGNWIE
jgi:flagellar assembly protein FliH